MADADFDDFNGYRPYQPHRYDGSGGTAFQRYVNGAGALTSVALIIGLGFWGYELAMRDVRGIPVIRALEGPSRVAPENPGGDLALHQGLSVNQIAADGTAAAPAESLTLAPRSAGLADDDQPMGALTDAAAGMSSTTPQRRPPTATDALPASLGDPAGPGLMQSPPRPAQPLPDGPVDAVAVEMDAADAVLAVIAAEIPGVARSLRPLSRPSGDAMAEAAAAAVAAALAPPPALDIDPEALIAGTRLVQIGAYPNAEEAETGWRQAAERFGSLLDGKRRVIEPATGGGQVFFRLRVEGFDDLADARRFCAALLADNAECVPAVVR